MDDIQRIINRIVKVLTGIGIAFLLLIMILTVINIIFRPFGNSIIGIIEISQLLIVITVSFAIGYTTLKNGHVAMDSFILKMPKSVRKILTLLSNILTLCIWGMIAWYNFTFAWEKTILGEYSVIGRYPIYPFRYIFGFGSLVLCIILIYQTIAIVRNIELKS